MSVPTIGQLLLNFRFGEMPTPYTPGALAAELAARGKQSLEDCRGKLKEL